MFIAESNFNDCLYHGLEQRVLVDFLKVKLEMLFEEGFQRLQDGFE